MQRPHLRTHATGAIAFDYASSRTIDADGHLHVGSSVISGAQVNDYRAEEIPNWEALGLERGRVYALLRDPVELEKAVSTFQGKPLLILHKPVTAGDHDREVVVGAIQSPVWDAPNVRAELTVWDAEAIALINSGEKKDLSAGYRYVPRMTPGEFNGVHYDGVMTEIQANHVALVSVGRVIGAFVGDEAISKESLTMKNTVLTRKAAVAKGALLAHLRPILAADAKIDLTPVLAKLTAANFKTEIQNIVSGVEKLAKGKLAKDAKIEGLDVLLTAIAMDETAEEKKEDEKGAKDGEEGGLKGFLKGKMSEDDYKAACDMMEAEEAEDEEEDDDEKEKKPAKDKKGRDGEMKDDKDDKKMDKGAMDAAIAEGIKRAAPGIAKAAAEAATKNQQDIREAEKVVRPWVGELAMAHDSADGVYRTALAALGIKIDGVHPSAYRPILEAQPVPGATTKKVVMATDAASVKSFAEMFPNAARVKTL